MAFFDLPLDQLKTYQPSHKEPGDFDAFWKSTLEDSRRHPIDARFEKIDEPFYNLLQVSDVTFNGYAGQPIKGWFIEPAGTKSKLPCIITYLGYGGGRSLPVDHFTYAACGFANLVMDTRGQGSTWASGDTPDDHAHGSGPQYPGFMTRGIQSPETYYFRRVFTDAARAIDAALTHPRVDPARLAVAGGSQGGGIAIAASGLCPDRVKLVMSDVPFLCDYPRSTTLVDTPPYNEISLYLKSHRGKSAQVFHTLSYFDGVNFAPRITARSLFSIALMDTTCPPSTCFAAYNRVKGEKELRLYDFNSHEGGGPHHVIERLRFAKKYL